MNDLIQFKDNSGNVVYSARELHAHLGSERKFTNWFEYQVESCNLIEGQDYSELVTNNVINSGIKRGRGRPAKDYALTFKTVLTIHSKSNQGTETIKTMADKVSEIVRPTIVDYAREVVALSDKLAIAEKSADKVIKELSEAKVTIEKQEPAVRYYDKAMNADGWYSMSEAVKLLAPNWKNGRNQFMLLLRMAGIFFQSKNEPKQEWIAKGYFKLNPIVIQHKTLPDEPATYAVVSPKGLAALDKWMRAGNFIDESVVLAYIAKKKEEIRKKNEYKQ